MRYAMRYLHGAFGMLEEMLRQNEELTTVFPDPTE